MHLIEHTPAPCAHCGNGNTSDRRDPIRWVDLERDINWNDPLILCEDCILMLAGLIGLPTPDVLETLRGEVASLKRAKHDVEAERDTMKRRAKRLGITFDTEAKVA